jgi:hypothetical protein
VEEEQRRPSGGALLGYVEGDAVDARVPVPHHTRAAGLHAWVSLLGPLLLQRRSAVWKHKALVLNEMPKI